LKQWQNGLGQECFDYYSAATGIWVTENFLKSTPQENTLLYELKLLQECLRNGGVSRNNQKDHNLPSGKITDIGIKRFYSVWIGLEESQRKKLPNLLFMHYLETLVLDFILYRIMWGGNALPLTTEIEAIVLSQPYVGYSCVEVQADIIDSALSVYDLYLQAIVISPQPPVIALTTISQMKEDLADKFFCDKMEPRQYTDFKSLIHDLKRISKKRRFQYCEMIGWDRVNELLSPQPEDVVSLLDVLSSHDGMEIIKKIDRNKFATWTSESILSIKDKILNQEIAKRNIKQWDLAYKLLPSEIDVHFLKHLGMGTLSTILKNDKGSDHSLRWLSLIFDCFNNVVVETYKNKSFFEFMHELNLKYTYYSRGDLRHHINALARYQQQWQRRFMVPKFSSDNEVLLYIADVFKKIVGVNKIFSGNWGTKGDSFALDIIHYCTTNTSLTEMRDVLLRNLQELRDLEETKLLEDDPGITSASQLPAPDGGTAMRIIHCLDIVACRIHEIGPQNTPSPQATTRIYASAR
jgi:hypothetical protein